MIKTIFWTEQRSVQIEDSIKKYREESITSKVRWDGPSEEDISPVCKGAVEEIKRRGGSVEIKDLQQILREKAEGFDEGTPGRMDHWVPHERCKSVISPVIGAGE